MARERRSYVCQACGAMQPRWTGRCDSCGAWNSITEEVVRGRGGSSRRPAASLELVSLGGEVAPPPRTAAGIEEFDRVLGGGIVRGSAILIGGDPGIGKSTLMLQVAAGLTRAGRRGIYVSGEESIEQVQLRARRLGLEGAPLELASATVVEDVLAALEHGDPPALLVIDSIQTMASAGLEAAPGTVSQIRGAADLLIRFAKRRGTALFLIGHVTKDGQIAGPRVLEHMVDTVLYFEGERGHQYRLLRAIKNRFGPANELGVFEMREAGLLPVANPSELFVGDRRKRVPGSCVFAGMEGSRPVLVEIQALVAPSVLATPRRAVVGWDGNRLAMVLAVLETRCGLVTAGRDIYLNVAGGLRVQEPAADLAVAAALISSLENRPLPPDSVVFGEIGLAGEVRAVGRVEARLREARKLGFRCAIVPPLEACPEGMERREMRRLNELVAFLAAPGDARPGARAAAE